MSKTLSAILTVFKIARIVAKVIFIVCIVGGVGCLLALCIAPLLEIDFLKRILAEEGVQLASVYPACFAGLLTCAGEAVVAFFAERYFGNVLSAGTPFTHEGAQESFRFGLIAIIASLASSIASGIVLAILSIVFSGLPEVDVSSSVSLSTGLFFLFLSLIFKYGAEMREGKQEEEQEEN